ncbi:hypothetical protein FRB94_013406 [Tulasnella sp. JGI-2019a]|nr:hypothetical protein FRB94_013406 [Tulasnella sp. JGI-2019a]
MDVQPPSESGNEPWQRPYEMGVKAFRKKKYANSVDYLSSAIQMAPDHANLYDLRAAAIMEGHLGRPRDALRDAQKVIQIVPNSHQGYARAATIFDALGDLSSAISMMRQALEHLSETKTNHSQRRTRLLRQLTVYEERRKRLTCNVAILPVEILSKIFDHGSCHVVEEGLNNTKARGLVDNSFVVRASHVCTHWRIAVIDHASLWQSLILGEGELNCKIEAWATRAKGSIHELILLPPVASQLDIPNTNVVLPLRIEWLHSTPVISTSHQRLWFIAAFGRINFPLLELDLLPASRNPRGGSVTWDVPWYDYGVDTLWALSLQHAHFDWNGRSSAIKCLVKFKLHQALHHGIWVDAVLLRLSDNPDLEELVLGGRSIIGIPMTRMPGRTLPIVSLARLHHLHLGGKWVESLELLEQLSLPNLRVLRLETVAGPVCRTLRGLKQSPILRELYLRACRFEPKTLIAELERIGGWLEVLEIHSTEVDVSLVVDALAGCLKDRRSGKQSPVTGSSPCPKLTRLAFIKTPKLSGKSIRGLVEARLSGGPTLEGFSTPTSTNMLLHQVSFQHIKSIYLEECALIDSETISWMRTVVPNVTYVTPTTPIARDQHTIR